MKSIGSIFAVMILIVVVLTGMQIVGEESLGNSNLDLESTNLIGNYSSTLGSELNYTSSFNEFESNLPTNNSNFDTADVFAQEYLESKNSGSEKQGIISRFTKIPDVVILALGVPRDLVAWIKGFILLIITTFIGFAGYRAFFGGGKITNN